MNSTTLPTTDRVAFSRYRKIVASIFIPTAVAVFCACNLEVINPTISNISAMRATLGGELRNAELENDVNSRGIVYALTRENDDPEIGGKGVTVKTVAGNTVGVFTTVVPELKPGKQYTFKAFGQYSDTSDIQYSRNVTFTTEGFEVTSPTSANITDTTATLGGEVISDVSSITERGVVYSPTDTNDSPVIGGAGVFKVAASGTGTGVFTVDVTGLTPGVEYTFKAYASIGPNNEDTVYSESDFFPYDTGESDFGVDGNYASAMAMQPDGMTLVGGSFAGIDGEPRANLVRIDQDGFVDTEFNASFTGSSHAWVSTIAVQRDGKILVGGAFERVNGVVSHPNLVRLNADGSKDTTFTAKVGPGDVSCIAIQEDGRILIGGYLINVNDNPRYFYLARLNANGTLDTTFNPGPAVFDPNEGPDLTVATIAVEEDGNILIGGYFNNYNGTPRDGIARLDENGTLDPDFDPGISAVSLALQSDGKILISGSYSGDGPGVFRLEKNGDRDTDFAPLSAPDHRVATQYPVYSMAVQADGGILLGGYFNFVGSEARNGVARLGSDGSIDSSFVPEFDYDVGGIALQADGKVLIGGEDFTGTPGVERPMLVLIENDPASSVVSATSASRVQWLRSGSAPEVSQVRFEMSINGGLNWTPLGVGTRMTGGWELNGLSLPANADIRARGRSTGGLWSASSGIIEASTIGGGGAPTGTLPTLTNSSISSVRDKSANLGAYVTEGDSDVTERGVVISRVIDSEDPRLEDVDEGGVRAVPYSTAGPGFFVVPVSGLVMGTYYVFRAYATNSAGTSYSALSEFKTAGPPRIEDPEVTTSFGSAGLSGNLITSGGWPVLERGVIYAPRTANANRLMTKQNGGIKVVDESKELGIEETSVHGLSSGTEYQFVAYARNEFGTSYTQVRVFTTLGTAPSEPEEQLTEEDFSGGASRGFASIPESSGQDSSIIEEAAGDPSGIFDSEIEAGGLVQALAVQPDGKTIVSGEFVTGAPEIRADLARLNEDGSVDATFTTVTNGPVYSVAVQSDGKILLGGLFTRVDGNIRNGIARLEVDGSIESPTSFSPGGGADGVVYAVALQPDGKILLGGLFENIQGVPRKGIARLHPDGSLDTDFDPGTGFDDAVYSVAVQADGAILVGGVFEDMDGTPRNRIARLEGDGDLDPTFNPGSGADERVTSVALQADGKILLGGWFSTFNGTPRNRIVRLLATGALDTTFDPGSGANDHIYSMALQADGKILVGGLFQTINGVSRNRIARLNANGSVDTTFDPGTGADGEVDAVALQEDGSILIGGLFEFVDGVPRNGIARLENGVATQSLTAVDGTQLTWLRGGAGPEVLPVNFEISTDAGSTWTGLGTGARVAGGWSITGQDLPVNGLVRALGRTSGGFLGGSAGIVEESVGYDHQARIAALRAQLAAANANVATLQKQIKAAKKKKNKSKLKKLNASLKTAMAQIPKINADLAKY